MNLWEDDLLIENPIGSILIEILSFSQKKTLTTLYTRIYVFTIRIVSDTNYFLIQAKS